MSHYLCMIITIIHCQNPSKSIHQKEYSHYNQKYETTYSITYRKVSSMLPGYTIIELWNNLDYCIQNIKLRHTF